jgi:hypothetical protein
MHSGLSIAHIPNHIFLEHTCVLPFVSRSIDLYQKQSVLAGAEEKCARVGDERATLLLMDPWSVFH